MVVVFPISRWGRDQLETMTMIDPTTAARILASAALYAGGTTVVCECSDEFGPCESHGETLVDREGASSHTADELILQLCEDLVGCGAELSPYGRDVLAGGFRLAARCRSRESGTMWFDDDGETYDELSTLADQLEADLGVLVIWDDGYRIVRLTADCPLYV